MQLSEDKMTTLWPNGQRSSKVTVLVHVLNRAREMERFLKSVLWADRIIVLIDSRTTEPVEDVCEKYGAEWQYFLWRDDFSYPKNILTKMVPHGEWCFVMGSDFECLPETAKSIREFTKDDCNALGRFNVVEYSETQVKPRERMRILLWRSHPKVYWERLAHEEISMSAFREFYYLGSAFNRAPDLGILLHYGDHENTQEELDRKRRYYNILFERYHTMRAANMEGLYGILYSLLPNFETVDEVKAFMDDSMRPGFRHTEYGSIHSDEEIVQAMNSEKRPSNVMVDKDYD